MLKYVLTIANLTNRTLLLLSLLMPLSPAEHVTDSVPYSVLQPLVIGLQVSESASYACDFFHWDNSDPYEKDSLA